MNLQLRHFLETDNLLHAPPRQPYLMRMVNFGFIDRIIRSNWIQMKEEYNLDSSAFNKIVDWCVKETVSRKLAPNGVTVFGHYRYDEARCIYDSLIHEYMSPIKGLFLGTGIENWINCEVQIMVLGTDFLISREAPRGKY